MVTKNRGIEVGYHYHVLNRGVLRQKMFHTDSDYLAFENLLQETLNRHPLEILSYELMPNHWHFVVHVTLSNEQVSEFFHYLSGTHAKRFRAWQGNAGIGHVYQDKFKSFPVQSDGHLLSLLKYVERNALTAGLVERAELWRWGSLWRRLHGLDGFLQSDWPVPRPTDWVARVNSPQADAKLAAIQTSIRRGCPLGDVDWALRAATDLNLMHTLRTRGRPRKALRASA